MHMKLQTPLRKGLVVLAVVFAGGTSAAYAQCSSGFIANALCELGVIDKPTANALDDVHKGLGNPLDHAAPGIAEWMVPGSGAIVGGLQQFNAPSSSSSSPSSFEATGNYCRTSSGDYGPGPVQPLGSYCFAFGPWGPEDGFVVQ